MRILAIETSSRLGTVAVLEDLELLSELALPPGHRAAQALAPAIQQMLREVRWTPDDVQLIATTHGPGSFTGLRIGVTTSKTLAHAIDCEVLGVDTLRVIASQAPGQSPRIHAVIDAQRQQLFAASFRSDPSGFVRCTASTHITDAETWLCSLEPHDCVTGTGLRDLMDRLPKTVVRAPDNTWVPRASTAGRLAFHDFQGGERQDRLKLAPKYYRASAAEEKLARRQT